MPLKNRTSDKPEIIALSQLDQLPRVTLAGGASLGLSYRYALEFTFNVLAELDEIEKDKVQKEIYGVFEKWKNEYGVYPPRTKGVARALITLGFRQEDEKQEVAKDYIERQKRIADESGIEPKYIAPWECDDFADTPVKLFFKLLAEGYKPLMQYLSNEESAKYDYVLATVIVMPHNFFSEYQSADCIEAAFKLAEMRLDFQKSLIKNLGPLALETSNKRQAATRSKFEAKKETERKIIEQHLEYIRDGKHMPYKKYESDLKQKYGEKSEGFSISNICKVLKANKFVR